MQDVQMLTWSRIFVSYCGMFAICFKNIMLCDNEDGNAEQRKCKTYFQHVFNYLQRMLNYQRGDYVALPFGF